MFNKTVLTLALGAMSISSAAVAVTDAEFKAMQAQLNAMADQIDAGTTQGSDTQVGGYGEMHYNNLNDANGSREKKIDFHRFVLFVNHQFNSDIRLFTEFEVEHALAGKGKPGEVEIEQAYIQFDLTERTQLNAGLFLLPVGILNETHEPGTFYGVERNPVEKNIIPTTWWEGGAMLSGRFDSGVSYDVALHSGLQVDPATVSLRSGRQKVAEAAADNLAASARLKYTGVAGLELAATLQIQDDITQDSSDAVDGATLLETHAIWNTGPVTLKALYARWDIDGTGAEALGKDVQDGGFVEAGYKINPRHGVFVRHNIWDNGGTANDTQKTQTDVGYNFWPHEAVVVKVDYQSQDANAGDGDGINIGLGYQF
ncbi:MAG: porin [Gammaproteobacteria bacterium]|nr:porin [Gammaproteobacteria bacterium]